MDVPPPGPPDVPSPPDPPVAAEPDRPPGGPAAERDLGAGLAAEAATPPAEADVGTRLAAIEARLAEVGARLDMLAAATEGSLRSAVAQEVHAASAELRHTVSELGRLLVRDLGKLAKILAEHRDTIVAELGGPMTADRERRPDEVVAGDDLPAGHRAGDDAGLRESEGDPAAPGPGGDDRRWRGPLKRRRPPPAPGT